MASSFDQAKTLLTECADDPTSEYLLGLFPLIVETSSDEVESYRAHLANAANSGQPQAQVMHGSWLSDTGKDRVGGARLMTLAYEKADTWGLWRGYSFLSASGTRLSEQDIHRVELLADGGFPLAFGILAVQTMYRIADEQQQDTVALESWAEARALAVRGTIRGDSIAAIALLRIDQEVGIKSRGLDSLVDALSAQDPIGFNSFNSEEMAAAYFAWQRIFGLNQLDGAVPPKRDERIAVCDRGPLRAVRAMCEVRSIVDDYVCVEPFESYVGVEAWRKSSAYLTCRLIRLRHPVDQLYY